MGGREVEIDVEATEDEALVLRFNFRLEVEVEPCCAKAFAKLLLGISAGSMESAGSIIVYLLGYTALEPALAKLDICNHLFSQIQEPGGDSIEFGPKVAMQMVYATVH